MHKEDFDYYIFIDYSENLIGYIIIAKEKINSLILKIPKLKHYKGLKHKTEYLNAANKIFDKKDILGDLSQHRITELRKNLEICSEVVSFCKDFSKSKIFISVDDRQYKGLMKFMELSSLINETRFKVIKEGELKKNSVEYKLNLIIDTLLNLKRTRENH